MSILGERLLAFANQVVPNQHKSLLEAKTSPETYNSFFARRATSSFAQFGEIDLRNQHILDIGCGLGANLNYLDTVGARRIVGLDISESQISSTKEMFYATSKHLQEKLSFVVANAAKLPFEDNSFDSMVAADTFEHIDELAVAMEELVRVLKPSGKLYAYFPPFYAPWGAHMVNWITVPWCQVFFSETTILNVAHRLEEKKVSINSCLPPETRLDLGNGNSIPFVNHLTIKHFLSIVQSIPAWHIEMSKLLAPSWRNGNKSMVKFLNTFNHLPLLREMFTAKAVFILRKNEPC